MEKKQKFTLNKLVLIGNRQAKIIATKDEPYLTDVDPYNRSTRLPKKDYLIILKINNDDFKDIEDVYEN